MSKLGKKVAYLKGLAEGLGVKEEDNQGKLILALIDTLEAFAEENEELQERLAELTEYVEEIDSDVSDMEEAIFEAAEDSGVIDRSPCRKLSKGGKPQEEKHALTGDQTAVLLDAVSTAATDIVPFVMIGLYAGLRREEILRRYMRISFSMQREA